jgi:hypothetical protein
VQSAAGCCLVESEWLFFHVNGRDCLPGTSNPRVRGTVLVTLRRDGFASMSADAAGGSPTIWPVRFCGRYLFVDAAVPGGGLRVAVLE